MKFEIRETDGLGRIGEIELNGKKLITPNLFTVVRPSNNLITPYELKRLGIDCIFTNAYILYNNDKLKEKAIKKGIHKFLDYEGLIATDSGAFQQYMYNENLEIDPQEIERFQEKIGSDFPVILDVPVQFSDTYDVAREKVLKNIERAKENVDRRKRKESEWIGPIHGSIYNDLLEMSTKEMSKLNFGLYAIGGLVKSFIDYRFDLAVEIFLSVRKNISLNKPLHMFGLGLPQFFSLAIACGCDLMDSAAYMLYAKGGRYFTLSSGTKKLEELVEFPCECPICTNFSPKELLKFDEKLRTELLAKHNLHISYSELRRVRQAIREGTLWELVEQRVRTHPKLIKGLRRLYKESNYIEKYVSRYNKRGLFYISSDTLNRPIIARQINDIRNKYIVPKSVKFAIILPELEVKRENSPSVNNWLNYINNAKNIDRKLIHVLFMTTLFGIVPLELIDTYPFGQNETIAFPNTNEEAHQSSIKFCIDYFEKFEKYYEKCGILIPQNYYNEFNEEVKFPDHPVKGIQHNLEQYYPEKTIVSDNLSFILEYFLEN